MNINEVVKKNQRWLLIIILMLITGVVGAIYFLNVATKKPANQPHFVEDEVKLEPDLTGSVSNTFDEKLNGQIITDVQVAEKDIRNQLKEVTKRLDSVAKENQELKDKLREIELQKTNSISVPEQQQSDPNNPVPTLNTTGAGANVVNRNISNVSTSRDVITFSQPPAITGQFVRKTYKSKKKNSGDRFYIPSGSFSEALVLEGADANASVTARETDNTPMQFKLKGDLNLPSNNKLSKLDGCFVTAGTYGDISSERAIVRLERLSCVIKGKHIDQKVKGHVAFYGKNGIQGVPVMRNGKILGLAFGTGVLSGLGNSISQVGNTTVGIGATSVVSASEVARQSIGSGLSSAANKLADYYIKVAEQYHPIIPIGAANKVEVVFQEGFWAEFIEDQDNEEKTDNTNQERTNQQSNANSGLPPELINQLGEIQKGKLSDFVVPQNK